MGFLVTLLVGRGLSALAAKAIVYVVIAAIAGGLFLTVTNHYVNKGWYKHKAAVEKQDNRAVEASKQVEEKTQRCSVESGFWDVITQACKLQEEEIKR